MNKDSKQRNVIITVCLWLAILANLAMTVGFIVSMYSTKAMDEALGFGLCSMFTFANVLGAILLLRWNKYGLGLTVVSVSLQSIVYAYVLNLGLIPTIQFIGAVAFLYLILQIRKGGKSAWSQLKSGWDSKHCRHIYQIVAVIELILFILTLFAFGGNKQKHPNPESTTVLQDTIAIEKQRSKSKSREIQSKLQSKSENPDLKTPDDKTDNDGAAGIPKSTGDKATPEKDSKKSYSIDDAARYLDTQNVWNVSEMSHYPDLRNLYMLMERSIYTSRNLLPYGLTSKSTKLREISMLLKEVERRSIKNDNPIRSSRLKRIFHRGISSDKIKPYIVCKSLKEILDEARSHDRMKKSNEKWPNNGNPSNEKRVKKNGTNGNSVHSDSTAARECKEQ